WARGKTRDCELSAKVNLWSEYGQNAAAVALRGVVKLPTGKKDVGVSTGKPDFSLDLVVSKDAAKLVEVSGYGGYEFRGNPDGFDSPTAAFPRGTGLTLTS